MEWLKDIWPIISAPIGAALMALLQWAVNRREREIAMSKTEAERQELLARTQKTLSESEDIEFRMVAEAMGVWKELYEARESEIARALKEAQEANSRSKETERKYNVALKTTERLEDLLTLAITFIDTLVSKMTASNIEPPAMPQQLTDWVAERNHKEH